MTKWTRIKATVNGTTPKRAIVVNLWSLSQHGCQFSWNFAPLSLSEKMMNWAMLEVVNGRNHISRRIRVTDNLVVPVCSADIQLHNRVVDWSASKGRSGGMFVMVSKRYRFGRLPVRSNLMVKNAFFELDPFRVHSSHLAQHYHCSVALTAPSSSRPESSKSFWLLSKNWQTATKKLLRKQAQLRIYSSDQARPWREVGALIESCTLRY